MTVFVLLLAYFENMKKRIMILVLLVFSNILVFIPQNIETFAGRSNYSDVRLHPLYSYRISLLFYENAIDKDKYISELLDIDKVIDIDIIEKMNHDLGEDTYADGYIRWKDGYIGVRDDYSMDCYKKYVRGELSDNSSVGFGSTEYMSYANACKRIFYSEPIFYLKTCFNTLLYSEKMGYLEGGGTCLITKTFAKVSYSILLVAIVNLLLLIVSLFRKKYFHSIVAVSLFIQAGIVFLLSPAAYYKYYLPICFCVYLNGVLMVISELCNVGEWSIQRCYRPMEQHHKKRKS